MSSLLCLSRDARIVMARDGELQRRLPCHSVPARQIDGVGRILKKNGLGGSISHPVLDVMRRRPLRDNRQVGSDLGMGGVVHVLAEAINRPWRPSLTKAEVYPAFCLSPHLLPSWLGSLGSFHQEKIMQDRAPSRTRSKIPGDGMIGLCGPC
jgi:hypothetical protein